MLSRKMQHASKKHRALNTHPRGKLSFACQVVSVPDTTFTSCLDIWVKRRLPHSTSLSFLYKNCFNTVKKKKKKKIFKWANFCDTRWTARHPRLNCFGSLVQPTPIQGLIAPTPIVKPNKASFTIS